MTRRTGLRALALALLLAVPGAPASAQTNGAAAREGTDGRAAGTATAAPAATEDDPGARGRAMQRRVYADVPNDDPWLRMGQEQVFAQVWTRPGLSMRDRRLVSLTAAAYAASPPGYISHIEGALDSGDLTPDELFEWLIHFTSYAGYPKAAPVWAEIRIALARRGVLPLPESLGPGRDPALDRERAKPVPKPREE